MSRKKLFEDEYIQLKMLVDNPTVNLIMLSKVVGRSWACLKQIQESKDYADYKATQRASYKKKEVAKQTIVSEELDFEASKDEPQELSELEKLPATKQDIAYITDILTGMNTALNALGNVVFADHEKSKVPTKKSWLK